MRAMAILYIGPHRNPDFATDYHISPILAPSHILAQFPPLLMQCGEKDPFVDDTVIFAGLVREAKRARKAELDLAIAGKSARFGEGLRMSAAEPPIPVEGARLVAMTKERDKLAHESEEDWVQMVLFSEWSHGYLQMPTLMSEARAVIEDLGDWIDEAFWRFSCGWERSENGFSPAAAGLSSDARKGASSSKHTGNPARSLRSPLNSETETDDSAITFVPKRFRSSPTRSGGVGGGADSPPHQSSSSWSDETLRDDSHEQQVDLNRIKKRARTLSPGSKEVSSEPQLPIVVIENGDVANSKSHRPGATPGWGSPAGKATGQTISETELMRRRRLLDAHIFD